MTQKIIDSVVGAMMHVVSFIAGWNDYEPKGEPNEL
jgi:hypothetical protein